MRARLHATLLAFTVLLVLPALPIGAQSAPAAGGAESAAGWLGNIAEIEEYLRSVEVVRIEDVGTGVTNPKRAFVPPDGPLGSFLWKPLAPGRYRGYWESYKAEIAAYEFDRLLGLQMVPVTVERRIEGDLGSAQMWLSPTKSFSDYGGLPTPPNTHIGMWNIQLIRAKMFHNLINNVDPNQGNWLVDPSWNLFLIDNSRAFTTDDDKWPHEITRVDRDLWASVQQLDEPTLQAALGEWLGGREIRAILERRDRMTTIVEKLVEEHGERDVFVQGVRLFTEATETPETVRPAIDTATRDLIARAEALKDAPMYLPPVSALGWSGQVVALSSYQGEFSETARRGAAAGRALGLVATTGEGTQFVLLVADPLTPGAFDIVTAAVGKKVEIYGPATESDGMVEVRVGNARVLD